MLNKSVAWPYGSLIKAWYNNRIVATWTRTADGNYQMVGGSVIARQGTDHLTVLETYK